MVNSQKPPYTSFQTPSTEGAKFWLRVINELRATVLARLLERIGVSRVRLPTYRMPRIG